MLSAALTTKGASALASAGVAERCFSKRSREAVAKPTACLSIACVTVFATIGRSVPELQFAMLESDAVGLTRSLLQFDTINPPGRERDCAHHAGALLEQWGFRVEYHEYAERRTSVVARAGGSPSKAPLCLTGHLDVVPLGARAWTRDPFAGETQGDRLYGRGSSDMKAGVAAMLLAAKNLARKISGTPGIVLVLTAAEE